ncbi:hypothetical protein [Streptomyces sp. KL116D]|uniref:hypothetical protein n=1 Tax=Streptomyces sp. KL116D TaxID=3045152 RepID=UPI0035590B78
MFETTCRATGWSGSGPTPPCSSSASRGTRSWRAAAASAGRAAVRHSKISRVDGCRPRDLARATTWMGRRLSPPTAKEVVVDADPVDAEHVRVGRGDDGLGLGARFAVGLAAELRFGQRRAVQFAGRSERQPAEGHEADGTM